MRGRGCFDRVDRFVGISLPLSLTEDDFEDLLEVGFLSFGLTAGGTIAGGGMRCSSSLPCSSSDTSITLVSVGMISTESLLCGQTKSSKVNFDFDSITPK